MSDNNLSSNLPPDVCVHSRIRGKSIEILQMMKKRGALMFWEVRDDLQLTKDLTWTYLRNLRNYGLIEKTKQGWYLTEKGKQFLEKRERIIIKTATNLPTNLPPNLPTLPPYLPTNLPPYNNNNNTTENNNINNIGNSSFFMEKLGSLENKAMPSFAPLSLDSKKDTHTYQAVSSTRSIEELQKVKEAFISKFGIGATIGKKVVFNTISASLPYVDKRSIRSRIDKLISIGFLKEVGEGLYKVGESNETV